MYMSPLDSCYYFVEGNKTKMKTFVNGEVEILDADPTPYCFVPAKFTTNSMARIVNTDLRTIDTDENVKQYFFNIPQNIKFFRTIVEKKGIETYEADVKYNNRWMMANKILCSNYDNYAAFDTEEDDSQGQPNAETANVPITAIGVTFKGQTETWAGPEKEILKDFVTYITEQKISMLGGWNSFSWDVPFLTKRLHYNNIDFDMRSRRWLDLMQLYRYTKGKGVASRWSLEYVGKKLLGKQKPFTHQRISLLSDAQKKERVGWDSETTWEIDQHADKGLQLSKLAVTLAKKSYRFPDDIIGINKQKNHVTVTPVLDNLYLMRAREIGYALPNKKPFEGWYQGAIIYISKNGEYDNVAQFDFSGMYPNILIGYKLAPYGKTDLIIPIVQSFLDGKNKSKNINKIDYWGYKILANAVYGLCASKHYRLDAKNVASEITRHAREIIIATRDFVNSLGYTVIYQDTDSCFVQIKNEDDKEFIKNVVNKFVEDKFGISNLKIEYETTWSYIEFPRGNTDKENKKRYYGMHDGKKGPEFEVVGLENVRGDWSDLAKDMQAKLMHYKVEHTSKDVVDAYVDDLIKRMYAGLLDDKLILSKNLTKAVDDYGKTIIDPKTGKKRKMPTPQHVRAYRDALQNGWIPEETAQYGVVNYVICKGGIPKLANLVKPQEISYDYYLTRQLQPILYRLGLIDNLKTAAKQAKVMLGTGQVTLF